MKHQENFPIRTKAFTLIEMLVVVAVISILLGILMPAAGMALHRARTVQCLGNLRKIINAAHQYADDHGDRFPYANRWAMDYGHISWARRDSVEDGTLFPYLGENINVYLCPEFARVYRLQPAVSHHTAYFSYCMNEYFVSHSWHGYQATRATILAPSDLGLFSEENPFTTPYNPWIINNPMLGVGYYGQANHHVDAIGSYHSPQGTDLSSGDGHGNVAFADGSVRLVHSRESREVFTPELIKRRYR